MNGSGAPNLVIPAGLIIDAAAVRRLEFALLWARARAVEAGGSASDVNGVVASVEPLPAGSSYRVHAETRTLLPLEDAVVPAAGPQPGVALLAPGVTGEASEADRCVHVAAGGLMVDAGAVCHDPLAPLDLAVPEVLEAPPFPWRPIVAVLALEPVDPDTAGWARHLVDALVDLDVEARLVVDPVPDGPHRTGPLPVDTVVLARLRPEVVIALDPAAATWAAGIAELPRGTTIIALDVDLDDGGASPIELVPWTIGRSAGRLRARMGMTAAAPDIADLVRRLVAGPHPVAPAVTWVAPPTRTSGGSGRGR